MFFYCFICAVEEFLTFDPKSDVLSSWKNGIPWWEKGKKFQFLKLNSVSKFQTFKQREFLQVQCSFVAGLTVSIIKIN